MTKPRKYSAWTAAEDHILRRFFPWGGAPACGGMLPERGRNTINERARALGVENLRQPPSKRHCRKPPPERPSHAQRRRCLRCEAIFDSEGIHNRVCRRCKASEAWMSGGGYTTVTM